MNINLDKQVVSKMCDDCGVDFTVVRGSIYDTGEPVGLYLVALHGHNAEGKPTAHIAISILEKGLIRKKPRSIALVAFGNESEIGFEVINWKDSPWQYESYLGKMINRTEALKSKQIDKYFHFAEHIAMELNEVHEFIT